MTTRKTAAVGGLAGLLLLFLGLAGCATPGPLHVYTLDPGAGSEPAAVRDRGPDGAAEVPSFLTTKETVMGFAYDPFTDHFFLRLAPGNHFRVVDRPARAIKREFTVAELSSANGGGGDLAIRPRDGHVFALEGAAGTVVEFNRYGGFVRRFALATSSARAIGIAYDAATNHLLVLGAGSPAVVTTHSMEGAQLGTLQLDGIAAGGAGSLAYDAEQRELLLPLANDAGIGVFGLDGKWQRTISGPARFVDVGPRSFLRMF
jgi:hypothetical protein